MNSSIFPQTFEFWCWKGVQKAVFMQTIMFFLVDLLTR